MILICLAIALHDVDGPVRCQMGASIASDDREAEGYLRFARPVRLTCDETGYSYKRIVAWCRLPSGADLSCAAIRAGVAVRWARYDQGRRLAACRAAAATRVL